MSQHSRQIHKETAISIATGLMVNFPLNFSLIYLWVEVLGWTDAFSIAACTTAVMTVVAYTRVYMIRRHFYKKSVRELVETHQG
jgi:hypothetical protein